LTNSEVTAKLLTGDNLRKRIESYATFILSKLDRNWYRQKCERYEGQVDQQGKPHGTGRLYHLRNGSDYIGDFKHGVPDGKGVKTYPNGAMYVGAFKNGFRSGHGIHSVEGEYSYDGEWLGGYYHGLGTYTSLGYKYTGQWVKNEREGMGESWESGDHYIGGFKKNQYHDKNGVLKRQNGDLFEGTFQDGAFRKGKVYYTDGSEFEGNYGDSGPVDGDLTWPKNTFAISYFEDATFEGKFNEGRPFDGIFILDGNKRGGSNNNRGNKRGGSNNKRGGSNNKGGGSNNKGGGSKNQVCLVGFGLIGVTPTDRGVVQQFLSDSNMLTC
jgi:hypothetical protein